MHQTWVGQDSSIKATSWRLRRARWRKQMAGTRRSSVRGSRRFRENPAQVALSTRPSPGTGHPSSVCSLILNRSTARINGPDLVRPGPNNCRLGDARCPRSDPRVEGDRREGERFEGTCCTSYRKCRSPFAASIGKTRVGGGRNHDRSMSTRASSSRNRGCRSRSPFICLPHWGKPGAAFRSTTMLWGEEWAFVLH